MFLANFVFLLSHLKIHPSVHLNTLKAQQGAWMYRSRRQELYYRKVDGHIFGEWGEQGEYIRGGGSGF